MPPNPGPLKGKTCLVTGASSGVGYATAKALVEAGADVAIVGRDPDRSLAASKRIRAARAGGEVRLYVADLSDLADVRAVAMKFRRDHRRLDVLINNAAVMTKNRRVTKQRHEATFATNYLAPFVLTNELLPLMKKSAPGRIINLTSGLDERGTIDFDDLMMKKGYEQFQAYSNSKLALDLYTLELSRRLLGSAVTANLLYPGMVRTRWTRDAGFMGRLVYALMFPVSTSAKSAARHVLRAASDPSLTRVSGQYFHKSRPGSPPEKAKDMALAKRLWDETERLVGH